MYSLLIYVQFASSAFTVLVWKDPTLLKILQQKSPKAHVWWPLKSQR